VRHPAVPEYRRMPHCRSSAHRSILRFKFEVSPLLAVSQAFASK
jgi:hypothetical protein